MESTIVFIDAAYLGKIASHFGDGRPINYDLNKFSRLLAKECSLWCREIYFYTAPPYQSPNPTVDEKLRRQNHDHFINMISSIPGFIVRQGRCQKKGEGEYGQKGVDSLIVKDLVTRLSKGDINKVILIACDTDFAHILEEIRSEYKIHVILAYFNDYVRGSKFAMSNHILSACDESLLISKKHFLNSSFEYKIISKIHKNGIDSPVTHFVTKKKPYTVEQLILKIKKKNNKFYVIVNGEKKYLEITKSTEGVDSLIIDVEGTEKSHFEDLPLFED